METVKDSAFINALLPFVIIVFTIGVGVVFLYVHFQKNLIKQKLKQETLKNIHQNELLRSNIEAQEEERKRIAQDLHDELGAVLSIMRMNMMMLEQQSRDAGEGLLPGLQNVRQLSETALASVRNISHRLMPPQLATFGLEKTLRSVTEQINMAGNINIALDMPPTLAQLPWAVSLGLYRIIMELVNNTIKHSGATRIAIDIDVKGPHLVCSYCDNGTGLGKKDISKGLGHKSIDGRINALSGTFTIETGPEGGCYASIRIPVSSLQETAP